MSATCHARAACAGVRATRRVRRGAHLGLLQVAVVGRVVVSPFGQLLQDALGISSDPDVEEAEAAAREQRRSEARARAEYKHKAGIEWRRAHVRPLKFYQNDEPTLRKMFGQVISAEELRVHVQQARAGLEKYKLPAAAAALAAAVEARADELAGLPPMD